MKISLLVVILAAAVFGQSGPEKGLLKKPADQRYFTEYDKFHDVTILRTPNFTVNRIDKKKTLPGMDIMFLVEYPPAQPEKAKYWMVLSGASAIGGQNKGNIIVLADGGKRFEMKPSDRVIDIERLTIWSSQVMVNERSIVLFSMDVDAAYAFAAGSKIEMQAMGVSFAIHGVALTIFREMAMSKEK